MIQFQTQSFSIPENVTAAEDAVVVAHVDSGDLSAAIHVPILRRKQLWRGL
jgi:hypothetical protein